MCSWDGAELPRKRECASLAASLDDVGKMAVSYAEDRYLADIVEDRAGVLGPSDGLRILVHGGWSSDRPTVAASATP